MEPARMRPPSSIWLFVAAVVGVAAAVLGADRPAPTSGDPLAREIERWSAFVRADTASDDLSQQVRASARPALEAAADGVAHGRRRQALLRFSGAHMLLAALRYTREHPEAGRSEEALASEQNRLRGVLGARLSPPRPEALAGLRPAEVRAIAEGALPQVRGYFDTALDYARSTLPMYGLLYLGQAVAQDRFVAWCRSLEAPAAGPEPAFRSIAGDIDSLQTEMLAVYRPPVSVDRHSEFIGASSALKEARELDALGLRRGALLRYLQATLRFQPLREHPPAFDSIRTPAALRALETRLAGDRRDHGIARLFLEVAWADVADTTRGATHAAAAAVEAEVVPHYLAAIGPAPTAGPRVTPEVTITLVRWPYT
jgi:hypothetical protein